jgi:hypothetical protein
MIFFYQEDADFIEDETDVDVSTYLKSENERQTTEEQRCFIKRFTFMS